MTIAPDKLLAWLIIWDHHTTARENEEEDGDAPCEPMWLPHDVREGWIEQGWIEKDISEPNWQGVRSLEITHKGAAQIALNAVDFGLDLELSGMDMESDGKGDDDAES